MPWKHSFLITDVRTCEYIYTHICIYLKIESLLLYWIFPAQTRMDMPHPPCRDRRDSSVLGGRPWLGVCPPLSAGNKNGIKFIPSHSEEVWGLIYLYSLILLKVKRIEWLCYFSRCQNSDYLFRLRDSEYFLSTPFLFWRAGSICQLHEATIENIWNLSTLEILLLPPKKQVTFPLKIVLCLSSFKGPF